MAMTQPNTEAPSVLPAPEPIALVLGEPYQNVPDDLYIPPDALEVILDAFEGPLDLLLYLIRRQNLDILDIPIAQITRQYIAYRADPDRHGKRRGLPRAGADRPDVLNP